MYKESSSTNDVFDTGKDISRIKDSNNLVTLETSELLIVVLSGVELNRVQMRRDLHNKLSRQGVS